MLRNIARFIAGSFVTILLAFTAGCSLKPHAAADLPDPPPLGLELRLASLDIRDIRQGIGPLEEPSLSRAGGFARSKTLDSADRDALRAQVERDMTGTGLPLHLDITVERAEVGWHGKWILRATEQGRFHVRIAFRHGTTRLAECSGSATLERPNIHATRDSLGRLFRYGLVASIHQCLEATREELKKAPQEPSGTAPI
ncbi:MAG TPA: hypothetical protein VK150_04765 [Geothrix sp.]|nr:hypothetical protein [Geothrix sp.]